RRLRRPAGRRLRRGAADRRRSAAVSARRTLGALAPLALVAGCAAAGKDYVEPEVRAPREWSRTTAGAFEREVELGRWWTAFADPRLDELIERARLGNLDLVVSTARVRDAR